MSEIFPRLNTLVQSCSSKIFEVDWEEFGSELKPYKENDVPKWTGMLLHFAGKPVVGSYTRAFGFLPTPESSVQTVVSKVHLLQANRDALASIELRNPAEKRWGGAIRSDTRDWATAAITGLPEIGDHLFMAQTMRECGLLTKERWQMLTHHEDRSMGAARQHAGMSEEAFNKLKERIFKIIQDGLIIMKQKGWNNVPSSD